MKKIDPNPNSCSVTRAVSCIGGKWKPIILLLLSEGGPVRFGRLTFVMATISRKILTQELRELEQDGLIIRHSYAEKPPRVEYELSELGRGVLPVLDAMRTFGSTLKEIPARAQKSTKTLKSKELQVQNV